MKVVMGLGNPGARYDDTRHNVGWWVVDRLAYDWGFRSYRTSGPALITEGVVAGHDVRLMKPTTFMNRSGRAAALLRQEPEFDPERDLLVVVDDAALDVGRIRFRPRGSPGGHNGLRSVSAVLGSNDYGRLRVGVGRAPEGWDLAEWVLSPMEPDDEEVVLALLPELSRAVEVWVEEGIEAAMSGYNR